MPTTLRGATVRGFTALGGFSPALLFGANEPGAFYDPSDLSTLFQDASGTTPVTAVEQPVGLMLDKSQGLVLGAELAPGTYTGTSSGTWAISATQITRNTSATGQASLNLSSALDLTRRYIVTFSVSGLSGDTFGIRLGAAGTAYQVAASGVYTARIPAGATSASLSFFPWAGTAGEATISNVSVREIPGAHASQSTSAARPTLRARYNLLERTEEFDNAAWTTLNATVTANAGTAPDGTTTADKLVETTANGVHTVLPTAFPSLTIGAVYTISVYAKAAERTLLCLRDNGTSNSGAFFDLANGVITSQESGVLTASITNIGSGWFRCVVTYAAGSTSANIQPRLVPTGTTQSYTGNGTSGIFLWGAQLLTAADQTATGGAYQRVGAATDYATGGPFRPYLAFDGSDDSMSTASVDFSARDEMTVFAGATKLSDATAAILVELSADVGANNGSFYITAPNNATTANYSWRSRGTAQSGATASGYAAPITTVLTGQSDISGDSAVLRANGAQVATSSSDQGTGTFGNYPLFIGAQNNASFRFNGRLYSAIVLGRTATAAEIAATEAWVNSRTGAY